MSGAQKGMAFGSLFGPLGMAAGAGIGSLFDNFGNKKDDTVKLSSPAKVELEVPSGTEGEVDGPGGIDKIPAMLTDGEFVMSRGAVQKYGVGQLEAMNASGGGTNKPKIMNNMVYASGGGRIGRGSGAGSPEEGYSGQITPDILGILNRLLPELGKRFPWAAKIVDTGFYGRVGGEAQKMIQPTIDYAGRVGGEVQNVMNQKISDTIEGAASIVDTIKNQDYGGMMGSVKNMYGAAEEAVPALIGGILGNDRIDRHISKDMQKAILDAKKTAEARGSKNIDYGDYEGGGLSAAGLTMGRVGDQEFKRDAQGRIVGLTQTFDTNRPAEESMLQAQIAATRFLGMDNTDATNKLRKLITSRMKSEGSSPEEIKNAIKYVKPGGDAGSMKDFARSIYKPMEALLDTVQGRGTTTHDVMFDKDVLGFDPVEAPPKPGSPNYQLFKDGGGMAALSKGKTVRQVVDSGRSANSTNPIMDFLGLSKPKPGADSMSKEEVLNAQKYAASKGKYFSSADGRTYESYQAAVDARKAKLASNKPNVSIPAPPPKPAPKVVVANTGSGTDGSFGAGTSGKGRPSDDVNAANPGSGNKAKWNILGIPMPF